MAGLRAAQAELTVGSPTYHGRCTVLGYSREFRPAKDWWVRECEYIEPLGAMGPAGRTNLTATALSADGGAWTPLAGWNDAWRTFQVAGNPTCNWIEFGDGSVYTGADPASDYAGNLRATGALVPRLMLSFWRYSPPSGQGIDTMVILFLPALWWDGDSWEDGRVFLVFPLATAATSGDRFSGPYLGWVNNRTSDVNVLDCTDLDTSAVIGSILAKFNTGGQATQETGIEQWVLEYEEDSDVAPGGHILLRNLKDPTQWQHYYSDNLRLDLTDVPSDERAGLACQGSVHYLNVSPLVYGDNVGLCGPPERLAYLLPTPVGTTWEPDDDWYKLASTPANWTVTVAKDSIDAADLFRPLVTFTRTSSVGNRTRPLLWYAAGDHAPTVGDADATATAVTGRLVSCRYTLRDNWRGASGSAEFSIDGTQLGTTWRRGGIVQVAMGQQTGCDSGDECAQIATAYIRPDGVRRWRDGDAMLGLPGVSLEFADWVQVRMAETCIVDARQAGGRTASEWFTDCAARLGMPASMVDVAAGIASTVITLGKLPSAPAFAAEDGMKWEAHFDAVCNAMGWRWGVDKAGDGKLFLDAGPTAWTPGGTPDIILDYDSGVVGDLVSAVEHTTDSHGTVNATKARAHGETYPLDGYSVATDADRKAGMGHDYWSVVSADEGQDVVALAVSAYAEHSKGKALLRLRGPLRRGWRPDMYLRVDDCPGVSVTTGSVWRLVEVSHTAEGNGSHETVALAVWVAQEEVE